MATQPFSTAQAGDVPDGVDAAHCIVCGGSNGCAMAASGRADDAAACWCTAPGAVDPAALAAIPTALRGRACLCPRCAGAASIIG
ncbi:cysteine-rich CWC family protein [Xylophilus ampelinus]|uniref:Cysteine-rich CWC n=1 Tax=Xylophilus ampelinus TaxID=54067 RepID=A0A318SIK2_9BURK|nr:cysteine-rich CWC family protein [Xylophilus ampelinus]MCS4511662.1 cysteine-rich CWC family protein [Xylophilus ampelinus]PYE74178.1 hypothetical protein DFQ15_1294 [Xylophilus ampelinus]